MQPASQPASLPACQPASQPACLPRALPGNSQVAVRTLGARTSLHLAFQALMPMTYMERVKPECTRRVVISPFDMNTRPLACPAAVTAASVLAVDMSGEKTHDVNHQFLMPSA